jgi:hypothetical protein
MTVTKTDVQVGALKELVLAKQSFDRALTEFMNTLSVEVSSDNRIMLIATLPTLDPREITESTLEDVLNYADINVNGKDNA